MRLRTKMTLGAVALLALLFGVCGSLLISVSFRSMLDNERESALRSYRTVQRTLLLANSVSRQSGYEDIVDTLAQLEGQSGALWAGVQLRSASGTLYRSGFSPDRIPTKDGVCTVMTLVSGDTRLIQVSGSIRVNDQSLSLYILSDITNIYEIRETQLTIYRRLLLLALFLGAAGSYMMAALLTRPLARLSHASRAIASGELSSRADVRSGDEVETLAHEFNAMAERLEANIGELTDSVRRQTEFMGSFAHELKTPMTSIIGYADLLRSHALTEEERQDAANYIFTEGRRLESLSLKLLDLLVLKKRDFELVPASPAAIVSGVVRVMRPGLTKAGITIRYRAAEGTCLLEPDLTKSLLINLIDNARKAMDGEGAIFIIAEMTDAGCRISVTDNGRGIPAGELTRITEAFYRVDKSRSRAQGGVGLGLALCNEIAKLHNGALTIRSIEGKGTSVAAELRGGVL